jgi:BirA family biotin operon repressor/biotin-[acetyl-CoA-carboxylase] ligase
VLGSGDETLQNGTVVLAEKQRKGRGRLERAWESAKGLDLTFSILVNDRYCLKAAPAAVNFGTAVAVANAISSLFQLQTRVKWPNDVLINKKKVAGILIETSLIGNSLKKYVIGIGINVNQNNFQGDYRVQPTSIALEFGETVEREKLLAGFLNAEEMFELANTNPGKVFDEWREKCDMIGDRITIDQNGKLVSGIFDDVDELGNILLTTSAGIQKISSGDLLIS